MESHISLSPSSQTCLQEYFITDDHFIIKRIVADGDDTPFEFQSMSLPQIGQQLTLQFSVQLINQN